MKIRLISDIHLDSCTGWLLPHYGGTVEISDNKVNITNNEEDQILVIAGDIGTFSLYGRYNYFWDDVNNRFNDIVVVLGNHDYYNGDMKVADSWYAEYFKKYENVHFLQEDMIKIKGVTFAGTTLWTDFDFESPEMLERGQLYMTDYAVTNYNGMPLKTKDILGIHRRQAKFIEWAGYFLQGEKSVLVVHHLPGPQFVAPRWALDTDSNPLFYANIDEKVIDGFDAVFCGHTHSSMDFTLKSGTHCVINPKGYGNENKDFNPLKVIEI